MKNPFFQISFSCSKSIVIFYLNNFFSYEEFEICLLNIIYYHIYIYKYNNYNYYYLLLKLQFNIKNNTIEILFLYPYIDKSISFKEIYNLCLSNPEYTKLYLNIIKL